MFDLTKYFKARYPGIAVLTVEQRRARREIFEQGKKAHFEEILLWSATSGFQKMKGGGKIEDTEDVSAALKFRSKKTLYIFQDLHLFPLSENPILNRMLADLLEWLPLPCEDGNGNAVDGGGGGCAIFITPTFKFPQEVEHSIIAFDFSLPTCKDLSTILDGVIESFKNKVKLNVDETLRTQLISAASGLCTTEAENAFYLSVIETGTLDPKVVQREKMATLKKSEIFELLNAETSINDVGGLDLLKEWIRKRSRAFSKEARAFGLTPPRGLLLVGVPGCGKSYVTKAIGSILGLPTLRIDFGRLFGSLVGESEKMTRLMLQTAEAVAPCVLFIDEIEKGLAGAKGGGELDSGVTKRVLGTFLTWMQERKQDKPVFVVGTCNEIHSLPPEFLRKGRFDEIFAVDLPNTEERQTIFAIHIRKRGRKPENYDLKALAEAAAQFTGSEIEEAVISGLYEAFDEDSELEQKHILKAIKETQPLAVTMKTDIDAIRSLVGTRARAASSQKQAAKDSHQRSV